MATSRKLPSTQTPGAPRAVPTLTPASLPKFAREVSVMAWVENATGQVLMVRQTAGKKLWTLPGGKARADETLESALRRELLEEIGDRVKTARLAAIFDRPEKRNLTILYRVRLMSEKFEARQPEEISEVAFKSRRPQASTPSASYFWKLREAALQR